MFRITNILKELDNPTPVGPRRDPPGPVVIWNLVRQCNLSCMHCYSASADRSYPGELSTEEVYAVLDDLKAFRVPAVILSGGEPLLRPDIFDISRYAKKLGLYTALSSNGTKINESNIDEIDSIGYGYVGVSVDGLGATHDKIRGYEGCFEDAIAGLKLCRDRDLKVGLRFTMTEDNASDFEGILKFIKDENIDRFYFSHLNYAGRGKKNRGEDAHFKQTRKAMDLLFDTCYRLLQEGKEKEFTTGNNDADGVYMLHWVRRNFPDKAAHIEGKLNQWGGNATGVNVSNIDNLGNVHPDSMWWHHTLGNVRTRPFSEIWMDTSDPLMAKLKERPRTIGGRCSQCAYFGICGGNTRVRAQRVFGDVWAEDPGCYLTDEEIGIKVLSEAS